MNRFQQFLACSLVLFGWVASADTLAAQEKTLPQGVFNIRDFGAVGDGTTLDTKAINDAITACHEAGGGTVLLPAGKYLSGTVHLQSKTTLKLDADARLIGTSDLTRYQQFLPPRGTFEAGLGKWHRALILVDGAEDVAICGPGVIDGAKVFDPTGEEKMRGPHTIIIGHSRNVSIRDLSLVDSANYAVMIEWSSQVEVRKVKATGGWDGVHFRASRDEPCRDIRIVDCEFYTGDDSIAGRYVDNLLVDNCVINSSCNGIRIIGPMKQTVIRNCRFFGPGVEPHRTSDRRNMLSGIILQPGAWDRCEGALEDVEIADIDMKNVATPVTVWLKRPGNTADNIRIHNLKATGVYRAAASVESWSDIPVGSVSFNDIDIQYQGGGKLPPAATPAGKPAVDARELSAWGFFARNARELTFTNVRLRLGASDQRPAMILQDVEQLRCEDVQFPDVSDAEKEIRLKDIRKLQVKSSEFPRP